MLRFRDLGHPNPCFRWRIRNLREWWRWTYPLQVSGTKFCRAISAPSAWSNCEWLAMRSAD
eukprot:5705760-Alexandrium_andersonii.AAC.1